MCVSVQYSGRLIISFCLQFKLCPIIIFTIIFLTTAEDSRRLYDVQMCISNSVIIFLHWLFFGALYFKMRGT